jgi:hypothetical protein
VLVIWVMKVAPAAAGNRNDREENSSDPRRIVRVEVDMGPP